MPSRPRFVLFGSATEADTVTVADVLRRETVGGVLMLAAAVVALLWANLAPASYGVVGHLRLGPLDVTHWTADGLLAIFFFVAGLELKRELTEGTLARPARALVPVVAALSGMVVPALVFLAVNLPTSTGHPEAWALPMATDIAFALAILAVVAPRLPPGLRAFLLTLAIVDDLGAILVIATVFTQAVALGWLAGAAGVALVWWLLQRRGVRGWFCYLPLGLGCWWCVHESGVHATIAGVVLGLLTRGSPTDPRAPLVARRRRTVPFGGVRVRASQGRRGRDTGCISIEENAARCVHGGRETPRGVADSPLDAWEHRWRPVSAGVAVPLFALFAAGVAVTGSALRSVVTSPLGLGIVLGLVVGKTVGVFGGAYLTARFTRAELTPGVRWSEVFSAAVLAGVGFTVALLVAELAFPGAPDLAAEAKAAVLVGSLLAALLASVSLRRRTVARDRTARSR